MKSTKIHDLSDAVYQVDGQRSRLGGASSWTLAIGRSLLTVRPVGGVRVEDTALLNANGAEGLTLAPKLCD